MQLNEEHIYDCERHPLLPPQWKPEAEKIFDFTKYPAEPNWDAYNQHMDSVMQHCIRKLSEQERQRIADFIGKGKEEPTMDYMPLTYPCPECGSRKVAQDPVCALVGKPLTLHFFCCDCKHQWDRQYEPQTTGSTKKEATMQVSYNGFTGELVKLEQYGCGTGKWTYELNIYDSEKKCAHLFTGVKMEDVKFLGGAVSFQ